MTPGLINGVTLRLIATLNNHPCHMKYPLRPYGALCPFCMPGTVGAAQPKVPLWNCDHSVGPPHPDVLTTLVGAFAWSWFCWTDCVYEPQRIHDPLTVSGRREARAVGARFINEPGCLLTYWLGKSIEWKDQWRSMGMNGLHMVGKQSIIPTLYPGFIISHHWSMVWALYSPISHHHGITWMGF